MTSTNDVKPKLSREEKLRDAKLEEQLKKSLVNFSTPEEKLAATIKKHIDLEKDSRKLVTAAKLTEKRLDIVQREKENLQQEYNKAILGRSKLEELCRELQRQNKSIKEESLSKIREEEEKRKETQAKFQKTLNEITAMMQTNNEKNQKLRDDNLDMSKKFKHIFEQYEIREQQVEKINKQMDLAQQLSDAKLAKAIMEATADKKIMLREKQLLLEDLKKCRETIVDLVAKEKILQEQLLIYSGKYSEFQSSIEKSNEVFSTYKIEIEKTSKQLHKMEKEAIHWRGKWEKSNSAFLDLVSEKQFRDQVLAKTVRQSSQLQKLCRTMQGERTILMRVLKENDIECPEFPAVCTEVEPIPELAPPKEQPAENDKLNVMSKNCEDLKKHLAQLQGQLTTYVVNDKPVEAKPKKNKNKKTKPADSKAKSTQESADQNSEELSAPVEVPTESLPLASPENGTESTA